MPSWTQIVFCCEPIQPRVKSWLHILVSVHWWTRSPCGCEIFILNPVAQLNFLASAWSLVGAMVWPLSFQVLGMWCMVFCIWWLRKRNLDWTTPKVPMKSWKRKWKQEPLLQLFQQIHTVVRNLQKCACLRLVNDYTQKYRSAQALTFLCTMTCWSCCLTLLARGDGQLVSCTLNIMRPDVASFSSSTLPSERYLAVMIEGATQHHLPTSWIATGHNFAGGYAAKQRIRLWEHVIMCQWYVPFCVECLLCVWKGEGRFSSRFLIVIPVETMLLVYSTCSCWHVCNIYLYIYIYILYAPCTWFHCFVLEEKFFPTQFYCTGVWCLTEGDVESTKMCASLRISKVSIAQGAFEGFYFSAVACLMTQIKL